jgi:hypothetical protein
MVQHRILRLRSCQDSEGYCGVHDWSMSLNNLPYSETSISMVMKRALDCYGRDKHGILEAELVRRGFEVQATSFDAHRRTRL